MNRADKEVIVIGGGLGGLFTAAILSHEGYVVTVLEKNATAGGGLQTFRRCGFTFETGMHTLGGFNEGGSLDKICRYLGIRDELLLQPDDLLTQITYRASNTTYRLPYGHEAFTEYLCGHFPHEADGIKAYVEAVYRLVDEVDLFHLRESHDHLLSHSEAFTLAADEFVARFVSDAKLRDLLAFMNPMYAGCRGVSPAYVHALLNVLYLQRPCRFADGGRCLVDALTRVVREGGGRVLTRHRVVHVEVRDKEVLWVQTAESGHHEAEEKKTDAENGRFSAAHVISAVHPLALLPLLSEGAWPKAFRERLQAIPETYSAFTVFMVLRENAFPYIDHTCYYQDDYGMIWDHARPVDAQWPHGFMYFTPPVPGQGAFARKLIVNCVMPFSEVRLWADSFTGHRPEDYKVWKSQMTQRIVNRLAQLFPGFREMAEYVEAASPLTIRDYYDTPEGALFGYQKDCRNLALSYLPVRTKVKNLWLTGQNVNLHGICGVPLTAIQTAEALLGRNVVVKHIHEACGDVASSVETAAG